MVTLTFDAWADAKVAKRQRLGTGLGRQRNEAESRPRRSGRDDKFRGEMRPLPNDVLERELDCDLHQARGGGADFVSEG
jgi:hypothetical protein